MQMVKIQIPEREDRVKSLVELARRGRILLLLEQGRTLKEAARLCGMGVRHVRKWAERYRAHGLAGLRDKPRPGRKPVFSPRGRDARGEDRL